MSSTQEVGDIFGQGRGSAQAMLRSPTVLILCIGLWGMNLFFYRLFGIDYRYILNYDLVEIEKEEKEKAEASGSGTNNRSGSPRKKRTRGANEMNNEPSSQTTHDLELMESSNVKNNGINRRSNSPTSPIKSPVGKITRSTINISQQKLDENPQLVPQLSSSQQQQQQQVVDAGSSVLWYKLVLFSVVLLFLLHTSTHYWMDHLRRSSIGAVFFFYLLMVLYIFLPLQQNAWLRRSFGIVLRRIWALVQPRCSCIKLAGTDIVPRRVPFVDVFFADAMCSLSKVFFDWGMLAHQAVHYPHPVPAATHNILIPSLCAALPYLIRARQCLIMFTVGKLKRDPHKHHHLMNAFKYSTSMYPLILSAYLQTLSADTDTYFLERTLAVLLVINASYSLYWDIVMDWGMMQDPYKVAQATCAVSVGGNKGHKNSCWTTFLRPSLRFGLTLTVLIVVADSFLRFGWTLKFVPRLFPSHNAFVLCTQFLEVFRRAIWNLLRVEWEHIKQQRDGGVKKKMKPKTNGSSDLPLTQAEQQGLLSLDSSDPEDLKDLPNSSLEMKILR